MMSASRARRASILAPSGLVRSIATNCLLRETTFHHSPTPPLTAPSRRTSSPRGGSILITSAPRSPRFAPIIGPAKIVPKSSTRKLVSGPARGVMFSFPCAGRAAASFLFIPARFGNRIAAADAAERKAFSDIAGALIQVAVDRAEFTRAVEPRDGRAVRADDLAPLVAPRPALRVDHRPVSY